MSCHQFVVTIQDFCCSEIHCFLLVIWFTFMNIQFPILWMRWMIHATCKITYVHEIQYQNDSDDKQGWKMLCLYLFCETMHTNLAILNFFQKLTYVLCFMELMIYHESKTRYAWKQIRFALNVFTSSMETFKQSTIRVKLLCDEGSPRAIPWETYTFYFSCTCNLVLCHFFVSTMCNMKW
jgi:hypothetical protein